MNPSEVGPTAEVPAVPTGEQEVAPEEGSVGQAAEAAANIPGMPSVNATPEQVTLPADMPVVEAQAPERGTVTLSEGSSGIVNTNSMTLGHPIVQPTAATPETATGNTEAQPTESAQTSEAPAVVLPPLPEGTAPGVPQPPTLKAGESEPTAFPPNVNGMHVVGYPGPNSVTPPSEQTPTATPEQVQ